MSRRALASFALAVTAFGSTASAAPAAHPVGLIISLGVCQLTDGSAGPAQIGLNNSNRHGLQLWTYATSSSQPVAYSVTRTSELLFAGDGFQFSLTQPVSGEPIGQLHQPTWNAAATFSTSEGAVSSYHCRLYSQFFPEG